MGKVKVVLYTTGDCIHFVSRFLFRNKWLHYWLEENICGSDLYLASQLYYYYYYLSIYFIYLFIFLDSLLSDNIACSKRSYCKTKCTVNGTIVTSEPKRKSEAWVESSKERRSPDPTQPDPTRPHSSPFFHSIAAIVQCTICSVLLNERLEKVSDNNSN